MQFRDASGVLVDETGMPVQQTVMQAMDPPPSFFDTHPHVKEVYDQLVNEGPRGRPLTPEEIASGNAESMWWDPAAFMDALAKRAPEAFQITKGDFESPLAYMGDIPAEQPNTGGLFTIDQIYDRAMGGALSSNPMHVPGGNTPTIMQYGHDRPSTNNWQLLPPGWNMPGYIFRNGMLIDTGLGGDAARFGHPWGGNTSLGTNAENSSPGAKKIFSAYQALTGANNSAMYWPGGPIFGFERWPYGAAV